MNEAPDAPTLEEAEGGRMAEENDESGRNIGTLSSKDPEGGEVTFSVDDDTHFDIETVGSTTLLKYKAGAGIDFEGGKVAEDGTLTIMLTATDAQGLVSEATPVTINVTNVNEAPAIKVDGGGDADSTVGDVTASFTVAENAPDPDAVAGVAGPVLGLIKLSDPDAGDTRTVTVDDERFQVTRHPAEGEEGSSLWLTLKSGVTLDHEDAASIDLTLTVTDAGGLTGTAEVTIAVTDVNEAPTIDVADGTTPDDMPARSNIPENQAGVPVGEITVSDEDAADAYLSDKVTVSDPDRFEVEKDDEGGLWLKLKDGVSLNFEETPSVDVTVTVTDSAGLTASDTVTVTVGNVNEPPGISVDKAMIAENKTGKVGTVTVTDNEEMRDVTLDVEDIRVVGRDDFEVVETSSGDYELRLTEALDFESDAVTKEDDFTGYVEVVLEVTDEGLAGSDPITTTETVRVTVVNEEEAPTISVVDGETPDGAPAVSVIDENSNADGDVPVGLIRASDPEDGDFMADDIMITGADAESFSVVADDEGMLWLMLNQGASADHEGDGGSLTAKLTVADGTNEPASATFVLTINDVNEAPTADASKVKRLVLEDHDEDPETDEVEVPEDFDFVLAWTAGDDDTPHSYKLDITDVFADEDGDTLFDYSIDGGPDWLEITEERVDGKSIITLDTLDGMPDPKDGAGHWEVEIVATDQQGESGSFEMVIVADDGDDEITDIRLYHRADEDGNEALNVNYEVKVDENNASEVVFGRVKVVDDLDDPAHPHGQHEVTVDNKKFEIKEDADGGFWLALKAGNALDHETDDPIELTITAKPMTVDSEGKIVVNKDTDTHKMQTVYVIVNDVNDAPKAIKNPGNWWVIVDDDEHDEDDVDAGDWLSFRLEMDDGDDSATEYPAFTDEDDGKNGDLRYELVNAPDWLEIDDETGVIRNKAKALAPESGGTYSVTVKATDNEGADDGLSDQFTFQLVVDFSGADDDDNLYQDNDEPQLSRGTVNDIRENPKDGVLVATFTVRDDDSALVGHPFAPRMPEITGVVNNDDEDDTNNDDGTAEDRSGYSTAFKIEHASGNSYRIVTTKDAGELLDYETVEDITISLSVEDGTGASDTLDISVDIDNVNEAPVKASDYAGAGNTAVAVEQSAAGKRYLWINLYDFWEDLDERQYDDDLTFTATANVSWIKVLHRPQKWEDLEEGKDDDDDDDDVTWGTIVTGTGDDQVTVVADDAGGTPDDDDFVVVFEIDRTKTNNKQADVAAGGTITLTARDEGGAIAAKPETIKVNVTDENLDIGANEKAVTLSGSTREGATLKARFDETKDPDLVGDPEAYQVVYTWSAGASSDGTGGTVRQAGLSDSYTMTQADVGMYINVAVTYRELLPAGTTMDFGTGAAQTGGSAVTTGTVRNAQDDGEAHFNILTNGSTGLTAEVRIIDEDGVPNAGETDAPVYTWQQSANGVSGWEVADGDDVTTDQILTLANGNGLYYRLVVTYIDEQGEPERIASDGVKVGDVAALADDTATPSLTGQWVIGGTQRVNAPEVKDVTVGVQWQMRMNAGTVEDPEFYWVDIAGATGRTLAITSDYAGKSLRVVVTHSDKDGITSTTILPSSTGQAISDTITNTAPRATMTEDYEIEAQIDDTKGVVVTKVTHTVPVATLFDDLDGDTLTYTVTAGPGTDLVPTVDSDPKSGAIWISANDAGLLSFDANTGELIYATDEKGGHDGDPADGGGNVVSLTIQASDGTAQATTDVDIRLNVKPTEIMVVDSSDTSVVEGEKISANTTVATLNVEDENSGSHKFGTHKVTVDDDRFQVVKDTDTDTDTDGSTWLLQVKKDAVFEFMEVDDKNMPRPLDTAQNVKVKLAATDGGDKKATFTIMRDGKEVEVDYKEITVTALDITNATKDDADAPVPAAEIPGLDDDADDGEADERVDGSGDDDVDGGWKPAEDEHMDGMMSSVAMLDDGLF